MYLKTRCCVILFHFQQELCLEFTSRLSHFICIFSCFSPTIFQLLTCKIIFIITCNPGSCSQPIITQSMLTPFSLHNQYKHHHAVLNSWRIVIDAQFITEPEFRDPNPTLFYIWISLPHESCPHLVHDLKSHVIACACQV